MPHFSRACHIYVNVIAWEGVKFGINFTSCSENEIARGAAECYFAIIAVLSQINTIASFEISYFQTHFHNEYWLLAAPGKSGRQRADFFVHRAEADSLPSWVVTDSIPWASSFCCSRSHVKYVVENRIIKQSYLNGILVISTTPWQQFTYSALTNQHTIPLFSQLAVKQVE